MVDLELRPTFVEINLDALVFNFEEVRRIVGPQVKILAVVKADAYGHGALECGQALLKAGADYLGVAFIDEAIALRQNGIRAKILLLGHVPKTMVKDLIHWDITPTVYQLDFAIALAEQCQKAAINYPVHLKVDTGMGRIGVSWSKADAFIAAIDQLPGVFIEGIFSHFSTADSRDKAFTNLQFERFRKILEKLNQKIPIRHIANSAAIFDIDGLHLDMVRPGIILYGLYPSQEVDRRKITLKPVMTFKTRIIHLKKIYPGDSLSYGNHYVAEKERLIGTLPVGYADGLPRLLSNQGEVYLRGKRVPLVGSICMDQCMVDLTDLEEVKLGEQVEIFGEHILADELAGKIGTINYEIVCLINKRVPRVYLKDGRVIGLKRAILGKQED